ncbi:hypothetical protein N0V88_004058 [Collariella sp. IMI 366227]|nr:hypothetical protein N0V88_004058 [Collariella sp. IMI 366227]
MDFLRDVLYDQPMGGPVKPAEVPGMAVLDFYDDANLDFKGFDFALLNHWNVDPASAVPDQSSDLEDPVTAIRSNLVKLWTESPWKWTPQQVDNRYRDQTNLPLPSPDAQAVQIQDSRSPVNRVSKEALHGSCRDRILATVVGTCRESSMAARVASSFPSTETIDSWINIFLAAHSCQVSSWIHYGSLSLNNEPCTEWLAIVAAAGATLTPVPAFRRFGFALQEAVRAAIPERLVVADVRQFEENNSAIGHMEKVQAVILMQDIGLWGGNRRKMEIAECHMFIPITMMRYRGKFGRSSYPDVVIYPADEGNALEEKWKKWSQQESWKRLAFHSLLRDAQVSMTQFNNPLMSYAELTLPLPFSKELWFAGNAEEFKTRYLESGAGDGKRPPSLGDLIRDINVLSAHHHCVDVRFAFSIYLHGVWALVWEHRQLASVHASPPSTPSHPNTMSLLLDSRRADLITQLKSFQLVARGWPEILSPQDSMLLHLLLLNLHVSLQDLQLLSGKEGEDQARRVYPSLQRWVGSADARQALWHAGQILRWGRLFPRGHLKDFWAVAVHHAALCMWTYGVVARASLAKARGQGYHHHHHHQQQQQQQQQQGQEQQHGGGVVYLDGEEGPAVQGSCMEVAQEILKVNFVGAWETLPPLSENIIVVLKQLEKAAWAVGTGGTQVGG